MRLSEKTTPASLWRAFFLFAGLSAASVFAAPPGAPPAPDLAQVGKPSEEEVARLVAQVRQAGIPSPFYFEFELRTLPRRGPTKTFKGQLWSLEYGRVTRVELLDAAGAAHVFLIERGENAKVFRAVNGRAVEVTGDALFEPLMPGVEVSAFDLQMPFLYWPAVSVEKLTRSVLGRPAWAFLFRPPAAFAAPKADVGAVRAFLDTQFNAIIQTEILTRAGKSAKTFSLLSLKRVGEQPIPKEVDYRNETTRDKTRLQVTAAALNLALSPDIFSPAHLTQPAPGPTAAQLVRFEP